jgi:hypothetical protein
MGCDLNSTGLGQGPIEAVIYYSKYGSCMVSCDELTEDSNAIEDVVLTYHAHWGRR